MPRTTKTSRPHPDLPNPKHPAHTQSSRNIPPTPRSTKSQTSRPHPEPQKHPVPTQNGQIPNIPPMPGMNQISRPRPDHWSRIRLAGSRDSLRQSREPGHVRFPRHNGGVSPHACEIDGRKCAPVVHGIAGNNPVNRSPTDSAPSRRWRQGEKTAPGIQRSRLGPSPSVVPRSSSPLRDSSRAASGRTSGRRR